MACPFFYPTARLKNDAWVVAPRMPLGDVYTGQCRADKASFQPDEDTLLRFCNLGYGRGCCRRFPGDAGADAVRFHASGDTGDVLQIQYIFERDCWPREHGALEYSAASQQALTGGADEILARQAEAFVESYRRRSAR